MYKYHFTIGCNSLFKVVFIRFFETRKIYKVRYHFNLALNGKITVSIILQAFRHRSNSIRVVDRVFYHRFITRVLTYQCYIGTVQGGNKRQIVTTLL